MSGRDDDEREFDLRWADEAAHKEPSARARMLAARWKDRPPGPVPFRAAPEHTGSRLSRSRRPGSGRRSPWRSTALVLTCLAALIVLLGCLDIRPPY
ncbi:hypothetical protein ACIF8T_03385 [Streptomyces sp. NPDC085946]|uniref:SCO2583/SCO2584 N-terminal domain-containing protein n=1 Tax=Streptomyces sp. NPDC085946 TaxID=3365744 RepID=UPI0037D3DE53